MSEFKVGDKVKAINESYGWGEVNFGDVGVVTDRFNLGDYFVEFPHQELWTCTEKDIELVQSEYPNPQHKHRDLIIAWANGADIEMFIAGDTWNTVADPAWMKTIKYRIKPIKTKLQLKIEKLEAKLVRLKGL